MVEGVGFKPKVGAVAAPTLSMSFGALCTLNQISYTLDLMPYAKP